MGRSKRDCGTFLAKSDGVAESMNEPALTFVKVSKCFDASGAAGRCALRDISFEIAPGETVAIVGRSGSGKSTLLHLAAGIDVPTSGTVTVRGKSLETLSEATRAQLRRDEVGFVFQLFHLLPHLTVKDNVALPELIAGAREKSFRGRVFALLERVGLEDRARDPVGQLSGGEMQRVAICRALLRRPALLLADEPTGSLDDTSSAKTRPRKDFSRAPATPRTRLTIISLTTNH